MKSTSNKYGSGNFWLFQTMGWSAVSFMLVYWNMKANGIPFIISFQFSLYFLFLGIFLSFLYRQYMVRQGWLSLNLSNLFPRIIMGSLVFGAIFLIIIALILYLFFKTDRFVTELPISDILGFIINASLIFMLWSSIYLNYNYYRNYEKEEVKNLKLIASNKEIELQNLKAQLNPHFIFNAMNSIRALIDENPALAQEAITKLSGILRSSLSNTGPFITIQKELEVVEKYLSLEKIRYEERLHFFIEVDPNLALNKIPPLLISTLVENAIKHGIARSKNGGNLNITIGSDNHDLIITVTNPGRYQEGVIKDTGIGLANIKKRLDLLFGSAASFSIKNIDEQTVNTTIRIPKKTTT